MRVKNIKLKIFAILFATLILFSGGSANLVLAKEESVYIGGFPLGFDLSTDGVLIVGLSEVICENGICMPARDADVKVGDYILSLNGIKVSSADDIDKILRANKEKFIVAEVVSDGQKYIKNIYPQKDISGSLKLGILIRDYLTGLGTVTFIKDDGCFCSLGHPIIDENGKLLSVTNGLAYKCIVNGIIKGERGKAGELKGALLRDECIGKVVKNSNVGLVGVFDSDSLYKNREKLCVGQAKPGNAEIYTTTNGSEVNKYEICIVKVDKNDKYNKNLVIKISDKSLIEQAGGIVQGMSGSPIVQDGKLVGAVTHVFLNDSTRGYGICIDNMINNLG